jgi:hypothetical protein
MESIKSVIWIFVSAGVILVSTAVLGGGIEVKEIKIPKLKPRVRFLAAILGVVFIVFPVLLTEFEAKPCVNSFQANPLRIKAGESSRIEWSVSRALTVNIQPKIGNVSLRGSATVSPSETTTYTLTAKNEAGDEVDSNVTVQVESLPLPVVNSLQATPQKIKAGENSHINWSVSHAVTVDIQPKIGNVSLSGSTTVSPFETTTYTLIARNEAGDEVVRTFTVQVEPLLHPIVNSFQATKSSIETGESLHIDWNVSRAVTVNIQPEFGNVPLSGTATVSPSETTTYILTARNEAGDEVVERIVVKVLPSGETKEGFIRIFNGRNLSGWEANENKDTFSVSNGMIVVNGDRSHLFYIGAVEQSNFRNFEFKADIMTEPGANSGIFFHANYQETGWPNKGYEAQINNTHNDLRKTGSLWNIQDVHQSPAKDNEWFTIHIIVWDKRIIIKINGETTVDYIEPKNVNRPDLPGRRLSRGTFALQGYGPESVVYYKNIMVKVPPSEPRKPVVDYRKEEFIRIFNGKNLIGWEANENKETFRVQDGMIVVNGDRSHLFYVGAVEQSNFRNFEFKADIMTEPRANGGVYFHTAYPETGWPSKGHEAQIHNTGNDRFNIGSLYGIRESRGSPPKDHEWFTLNINVQNKKIIIKVNNKTVVDYTEPEDFYDPDFPGRKLASGTFALQGFNPESTIYYKNIMVKVLP